ncbi:hypothetical protein RE474_01265 [Methanolobus sediminis]|uniref:Uncharacterized protein n=1 Tax=Methanolobus sediminis TaxID=3072978 RepID=A0AA51YLV7_9EURY|nr:hypothetical protein [Methanolobus sediminis]WMW25379.1 hypothetical protein RE474_01265 [Methanolobus sediminis]
MKPFFDCPRFKKCSVNNCPLDPEYPDICTDPRDIEGKCTLGKVYRLRIAERYHGVFKLGGMTRREFAALKAWGSKTPEEQAEYKARLKKIGFASGSENDKQKRIVTPGGCSE